LVAPTKEYIDALEREEIEEARAMHPGRKLELGGILFDGMVQRMRDGIRHLHPLADEAERQRILRQWLDSAEDGD
jgi:hypothetical protein